MKQIYEITSSGRLIITERALLILNDFRQLDGKDCEAGGVLLGRYLIDSENIVVDYVTTPQKKDRRTRTSFFRSKTHNSIAQKMWEASNHRIAYLGLWHTHPESVPSPSMIDIKDWEKAIKKDQFEGDKLFFLIVGIDDLKVWMLNNDLILEELSRT